MEQYFLITEDRNRSMFSVRAIVVDILETKKLCENTMLEREREGFKILKVIKGKELSFKPKSTMVTEYEIIDTIHLNPPSTKV